MSETTERLPTRTKSTQQTTGLLRWMRHLWWRFARFIAARMPRSLFGRSLIIIVAPMLLLQAVIAFVVMERHWQSVTNRLSTAVVRDIAGVVDIIETYPQDEDFETIRRIANDRFSIRLTMLTDTELPPARPKPFFSILDTALSEQLTLRIDKPYWIDTVGDSGLLEIRILLDNGVARFFVRRSNAYASNTHIFLLWMVGASVVLIAIAILFLRNQIRPIQRLAEAADRFGKGQAIPDDFRPRGAREVRQATSSFIEMRNRIERSVEQRTAMLAGVSHDLRTVLTRFRLQLALVKPTPETDALSADVDDMQSMLQGYLDFARGDSGEVASDFDFEEILYRFDVEAEALGKVFDWNFDGDTIIHVRPTSFSRLMSNLIGNAFKHGDRIEVRGLHNKQLLRLEIHDNGPGISEEEREEVFKPFVRLDEARNQDDSGTGLGLAIAKDIVSTHGGEIALSDSDLGGLKVTVKLPV